MRVVVSTLMLAAALGLPSLAAAHPLSPALLEVIEHDDVGASQVDVMLKIAKSGEAGRAPDLEPMLPASCALRGSVRTEQLPDATVRRSRYRCGSLAGDVVGVGGLAETKTDVLLRVTLAGGYQIAGVLRPDAPSMVLPEAASALAVAVDYLKLGVEHILGGLDHLLFVLALLVLLGSSGGALVKTITAFTLGHSATLVAMSIGWAAPSPGPVEAAIAGSVLLLVVEVARGRRPTLTRRYPWAIAGGFGLLHGFGFAGALAEIGLPANEIPLALLSFNVGVEIGQLAVVAAALAVGRVAASLPSAVPQLALRAAVYAMGATAAFWTLERTAAMF